MSDPTTNQLLADILNRLDALDEKAKVLGEGVNLLMNGFKEFMPTAADQLVFLLQAVKELQETVPVDIRERVEYLESPQSMGGHSGDG